MNKKLRNISGVSALCLPTALFLFPAAVALAQVDSSLYTPLVSIPGVFTAGSSTNPVQIIKGLYGLAIGIGSVIATVMIIWAGFEYMYVESTTGKSAAKERITNAFLGILVILGSYILLRTINPDLVEFKITLPGGTGGNLTGLIAADKEALAREKIIHEALKKDAATKAQITTMQGRVTEIDAELAKLDLKYKAATTDSAKASIQADIDILASEKLGLNTDINQKTVESTKNILAVLLNEGQDNVIANEIKALGTAGSGYKTSDAFNLILNRKNSTFIRLNSELAKMEALPETPDKANLVSDFKKDIDSYKDYLTVSKNLIAETQQILSTQPIGYYSAQNTMKFQDPKFRQLANETEIKAKTYETTGRPELANQLRDDLKNSMLIVKMRFGNYCTSKTLDLIVCTQ